MPDNFAEITYESLKTSQENNGNRIVSSKDRKRWFPRDASLEVYDDNDGYIYRWNDDWWVYLVIKSILLTT